MDVLEEHVSEERDPEMNEQQDIRMEENREEYWRDVAEDGKDKRKIDSLRWDA